MKRFFSALFALWVPWSIFLVEGYLGYAFLALILQMTVIGWPFASIWAWKVSPILSPPQSKQSEKPSSDGKHT